MMTQTGKEAIVGDIRSSIEAAVKYLSEHPDEARYTDPAATATMQDGLRFHVTGAGGEEIVTDRVVDSKTESLAAPRTEHLHPLPGNGNGHGSGNGNGGKLAVARAATSNLKEEKVRLARLKGYEGDPCSECGQLTLIRSGACCKCDTCGATSGCS